MATIRGRLPPMVDDVGRERIGRYRLASRIATGGMAEVYLAVAGELTGFRTLVVVKRVLPHLASDRNFIRMFLDEARLATLLDHPNIARVIEIGKDGGDHFLAIEAVPGPPLSAVLNRTVRSGPSLSQAEIAFIIAQAAQGLGYAHRLTDTAGQPLNVVHRDVSPQNLLVSFEGTVKVIDFGVARALGRLSMTRPGQLKGKLAYMSPEQLAPGHVDRRSDLFSLGVVLWELLCGERLFARSNDAETRHAILDRPIVPPSRMVAIPAALESIVMHALEKKPERRFETAESMALALDRFAFATEGFDPVQIGKAMRELFAPEYQWWKDRMATAIALGPQPEPRPDPSGTPTRERAVDLEARVPTVVLRRPTPRVVRVPLLVPIPPARPRSEVMAPARPYQSAVPISPSGVDVRGHRGGVAVIVGALALVCFGVGGIVAARWRERTIAPARQGTAVGRLAEAIVVASATSERTAPAPIPESPAPAMSMSTAERRTSAPSSKRSHRQKRRTSTGQPRYAPPKTTISASAGESRRGQCTIMLGTQPWSEVWIDGHSTNHSTPYWERIDCGLHQVTFKRDDLGLARTIAVTVSPGKAAKRTVDLAR